MLYCSYIQFIQGPNDHYFANPPIFERLVYLEVERVGADTLFNLLNNAKNLRTLVLKNVSLFGVQVVSIILILCLQISGELTK